MTKAEFVSQVAEKAGISRAAAGRAVEAIFGPRISGTGLVRRVERAQQAASPGEPASVSGIRELALSVWENAQDAGEFLSTPHAMLDGETPLAAAQTPEGAERVREILLALEYGLPV
ncbi:MAG TPA: antitoxin Xre/MbcA/ParS toxin-binding domain-containing protein [Longimicrobium sp.]